MNSQWNDPRIWEAVRVLLQRPNAVSEIQPRSLDLHPSEYALAYYLSKKVRQITSLIMAEA